MAGLKRICALATFLILTVGLAVAADISVPELEMLTYGAAEGDSFVLRSRVFLEMLIQGGSKYTGSLKLGFNSGNIEGDMYSGSRDVVGILDAEDIALLLEKTNNPLGIAFKGASVSLLDVFGSPVEVSYFIGSFDVFCSGRDFPKLFGTAPFASMMRGFAYFPDGIGENPDKSYDGLHAVYGTGAMVSMTKFAPWLAVKLYTYQDSYLGPGKFSSDARMLLNFDNVKFEVFGGASYPVSSLGAYRGGFLFFVQSPGDQDGAISGDLFAQIGVPYFDPAGSGFGIDQFYFLVEPRLNFNPLAVIVTLFYHPSMYLQQETGESGAIDLNFNLLAGNLSNLGVQGGAETMLSFRALSETNPLTIKVSPYFSALAGGIIWDFKANVRILPWKLEASMVSGTVGLKAGF